MNDEQDENEPPSHTNPVLPTTPYVLESGEVRAVLSEVHVTERDAAGLLTPPTSDPNHDDAPNPHESSNRADIQTGATSTPFQIYEDPQSTRPDGSRGSSFRPGGHFAAELASRLEPYVSPVETRSEHGRGDTTPKTVEPLAGASYSPNAVIRALPPRSDEGVPYGSSVVKRKAESDDVSDRNRPAKHVRLSAGDEMVISSYESPYLREVARKVLEGVQIREHVKNLTSRLDRAAKIINNLDVQRENETNVLSEVYRDKESENINDSKYLEALHTGNDPLLTEGHQLSSPGLSSIFDKTHTYPNQSISTVHPYVEGKGTMSAGDLGASKYHVSDDYLTGIFSPLKYMSSTTTSRSTSPEPERPEPERQDNQRSRNADGR